jgi:putative membrane protein
MPYRNVTGWLGTGALFMSVAACFWQRTPLNLTRTQLWVPLAIYLANFSFGAVITVAQLDSRFWIPTAISVLLGVVPAIALWWVAKPVTPQQQQPYPILEEVPAEASAVPVGVSPK